MKIYNSFSKELVEVEPNKDGLVGIYACGPTVYDYTHIGHGRKYVNDDVMRRALRYLGYKTRFVMNITDVGHLVSDSDEGEDKLEKGAAKSGKTVWRVAEEFTSYFHEAMSSLAIIPPDVECKATDHIQEQIEMVKGLIAKGFAYETDQAIYFEVAKFPRYANLFGQSLEEKVVAAREEVNTDNQKRSVSDFALWFKCVGRFSDHQMRWVSPWGEGFPGWHIECSAMSRKYLGDQFEIHTGGEDHKSIHHPNEIAQSEAYTGIEPFAKIWMHHAFLKINGAKMSKSHNNYLRVEDVTEKGFESLALRYMYLTTHYRKVMNFTFESLEAAATALKKLRQAAQNPSEGKIDNFENYDEKFSGCLENDLNMAEALAVVWEVVKSDLTKELKTSLLKKFDQVLGLDLFRVELVSEEVKQLLEAREKARAEKNYELADQLREQIGKLGYQVKDSVRK